MCLYSVFNVKVLVGAFNQEKALVGAFSVIVKTGCGTDGSFYSTNLASSDFIFIMEHCLMLQLSSLQPAGRPNEKYT